MCKNPCTDDNVTSHEMLIWLTMLCDDSFKLVVVIKVHLRHKNVILLIKDIPLQKQWNYILKCFQVKISMVSEYHTHAGKHPEDIAVLDPFAGVNKYNSVA